eukprot:4550770-Ditylum_brightwellii.AAC.1
MKLGKRWQPPQEPSCAKLAVLVDNDNNGHDCAEMTTHQRVQKGRRGKTKGALFLWKGALVRNACMRTLMTITKETMKHSKRIT